MKPPPTVHVVIGITLEPRRPASLPRVLITLRPADTVLGGYWEFPGGKREPGESDHACLVREFHEELALPVEPTRALPVIEHRYDHRRVVLRPYYCRPLTDSPPIAQQVDAWKWVEPAELTDHRFPPANAALLARIAQDLAAPAP
ncbi:MAG: (deoxy)nucleoside triphosphate pyrophosphohydrolase [Planctomycetota bacterium]